MNKSFSTFSIHSILLSSLLFSSCSKKTSSSFNLPSDTAIAADVLKTSFTVPETISFNEHVQPILSETCYHCHGPDSGTRAPKKDPLRLDRAEFAFAKRENGTITIKPGAPAASEIIKLIKETDPDLIMPKPESHKTISPQQLAILEKWIEQGAKYEEHWSFIKPLRPAVPATNNSQWAKNPIDSFILEKIEANGLSPNSVENPRRLYRRLAYDLKGLPPQPEEIDAFEKAFAADQDKAISDAADRMMASNEGAEHFARHWLDAARYADTHGIHIDNYRAIWPYRDWVISAFKNNMPWDQFTIEQFGGDLLPNATLDQKVATGFQRCIPTTGEGGAIPEEYEAIYANDRVSTMSALWLGLTTQCAACHDHKFDPVSTKEFYQLTAFFRNTTMRALDGNQAEHAPAIFVPPVSERARYDELDKLIATEKSNLATRQKNAQADFDKWASSGTTIQETKVDSSMIVHLPLNESAGPILGSIKGKPYTNNANVQRREGKTGQALLASAQTLDLEYVANFERKQSFSYSMMIYTEGQPTGPVIAHMDEAKHYRGWDLWLDQGVPAVHIIDYWPDSASKFISKQALQPGKWQHIAVTFDGSKPAINTVAIYIDGKKVATSSGANRVGKNIQVHVPLTIGKRTNGAPIQGTTAIQDLRIYDHIIKEDEIAVLATGRSIQDLLALPVAERKPEDTKVLQKYYLDFQDAPSNAMRAAIVKYEQESAEIKSRGSACLIMQEKNEKPFAHILARGSYADKSKDPVYVGVPAVLPPMTKDMPENRLGLGQWLVSGEHPLTARVTVNRLWGYLFANGIVETVEDFGIMGGRPSHPKLLDWLASEFVSSKWNYRHIAKLIVTSATYRQSANISAEAIAKDPTNKWLARAPRIRLEAEALRDTLLLQSDLLSKKIGGPSVKPYQPEGIWEAVAMHQSNTRFYKQDSGDALYRRSMYTFWKRTAPPPSMEILNAPSREVFCVRRERTNTPLQAFVTLNDPQFVEASRQLAAKTLAAAPDETKRIQFIAARLLGRSLSADQLSIVQETLKGSLEYYQAHAADATALISIGETKPNANLPAAELAAWTIAANQVFNFDESLTK